MILALDTATPFLVLGLLGEGVALEHREEVGRAHAERLGGAVAELTAGVRISAVAVGIGPGSYTGLRVGASYALGLGRALGVPVRGVSTLEALAAQQEGLVAASLDARRGQVYGGVYQIGAGLVVSVRVPEAKYPQEVFTALAEGAIWLRDAAPSGLALARLSLRRGQTPFTLRYL